MGCVRQYEYVYEYAYEYEYVDERVNPGQLTCDPRRGKIFILDHKSVRLGTDLDVS